ncbi:hypothetical protein T492DRAFT_1006035 [Pavlovales sp. CCMP2436]|nr:hypothetical protein T492DRAFT_1006035 [Pavlovales sp. CCMP2436]
MKMLRRSPSSSPSACGLRHVPVSLRQRRRIRSVYLIRSPHTSQAETSTTPRWAWQAPSRLKTPPNGRSRPSRCCQTSKQHGNEECSSISCPVLVLGGVGLHLARLEPLVLVRCHARRPLVTDLALPRALPVSRPVRVVAFLNVARRQPRLRGCGRLLAEELSLRCGERGECTGLA